MANETNPLDPIKTPDGQYVLVDAHGRVGSLPAESLAQALQQGYRFATPDENKAQHFENKYGDAPVTAALEGAARSVTFGGTDFLADLVGEGEGVRERRQRNPGAAMVGELGGLATGVGAAGLVSRAGAGAAAAAGGRLVGSVARGATEGALLGVQSTISDVALSEDPLTAEAVAGGLAKHVLLGGALGGAGGALGELVSGAAGKVRQGVQRFEEDLTARSAELGRRAELEAARKLELERLEQLARPQRAALADELVALSSDQRPFREALVTRLSSAPKAVVEDLRKSERSLGGMIGDRKNFMAAPERARLAVADYEHNLRAALGTDPPAIGSKMLDRVAAIREQLEPLAGPPRSAQLLELDEKLAAIGLTKPKAKEGAVASLAKDAASKALLVGAGALLHELPGAGMLAFLLGAGKIGGRLGDVVSAGVKARAAEVGASLARVAGRVMSAAEAGAPVAVSRAAALSPEAFDDMRTTVLEAAADPAALEARLDAQLDGVRLRDPMLAEQLKAIQRRGILHLAEVAPKSIGSPTLTDMRGQVSRLERDRFLRRAEVVLDPTTLLDALEDGTLTPAQVQTADAVYVELMSNLRGRLLEQLGSGEISPRRRLALSILLGAPATPSLRPENIAAAQARINQEIQNAARRPTPTGQAPARPEEQTSVQRRAGR